VNGKHYVPVVDSEPEASDYALLIVATKSTHLQDALPIIRSAALPSGDSSTPATVVSLLNGISSEEILRTALGHGSERFVVPAMILGIDAVRDGAEITYLNRGTIHYGADAATAPIDVERLDLIDDLLGSAGIPVARSKEIMQTLWWKFMINVGINQASAVLRAPYGLFQTSEPARELMTSLMAEVLTLSRAAGTGLTDDHLKRWLETLQTLDPEGKTSMLQDVEARRPTEVDLFAETVERLGKEYGVPTPVNRTIFHTIRAIEEQAAGL
jgi:2-dehydropantoate 2-reductase